MMGSRAVDAYNAYVLGIHNYYRIATNITLDMRKIAFLVKHELNARLRRYTQKSGDKLPSYIAERYGNSKMLRYVYGRALIPIGYLKHKAPCSSRRKSIVTPQKGEPKSIKPLMRQHFNPKRNDEKPHHG